MATDLLVPSVFAVWHQKHKSCANQMEDSSRVTFVERSRRPLAETRSAEPCASQAPSSSEGSEQVKEVNIGDSFLFLFLVLTKSPSFSQRPEESAVALQVSCPCVCVRLSQKASYFSGAGHSGAGGSHAPVTKAAGIAARPEKTG